MAHDVAAAVAAVAVDVAIVAAAASLVDDFSGMTCHLLLLSTRQWR